MPPALSPSNHPDAPLRAAPNPHPLAWLPNALVWLRLVLAAVFVALLSVNPLAHRSALLWAVAIFIVAALTDLLDGRLARAWNCVSRFGRIMDSFADKILILGAFVCLAGPQFALPLESGTTSGSLVQVSGVFPWMVVLILGRELLVTSLRGLVEGEGGDFSAITIGKLKMVAQSVAVPLILLLLALAPQNPEQPPALVGWANHAISITAWLTVLITVFSSLPYIHKAFAPTPHPHDHPHPPTN